MNIEDLRKLMQSTSSIADSFDLGSFAHLGISDHIAEQRNVAARYAEAMSVKSIAEQYCDSSRVSDIYAGRQIAGMKTANSALEDLERDIARIVSSASANRPFLGILNEQQEQMRRIVGSGSGALYPELLAQTKDAFAGSAAAKYTYDAMSGFDEIQQRAAALAESASAVSQPLVDMRAQQEAQWRRMIEPHFQGISQVAESLNVFVSASAAAAGARLNADSLFGTAAALQSQLVHTLDAMAFYPNASSAATQAAEQFARMARDASDWEIFNAARDAAECFIRGEEVYVDEAPPDEATGRRLQFAKLFLTILQVCLFGDVLTDASPEKRTALVLCALLEVFGFENSRAMLHDWLFADPNKSNIQEVVEKDAQAPHCPPLIAIVRTERGKVRLRAEPGSQTEVLARLADRTSVTVEPNSEVRSGKRIWVKVRTRLSNETQVVGWIARDLLDVYAIEGVGSASNVLPEIHRASMQ